MAVKLTWIEQDTDDCTGGVTRITKSANCVGTGRLEYYPSPDGFELNPPRSDGSKCIILPQCACGSSCTAGAFTIQNQGVYFSVALGSGGFEKPAGQLLISEPINNPDLANPATLQLFNFSGSLQVIKNEAVLRQVKAPQTLADIVVLSDHAYEIRLYTSATFNSQTGLYVPTGNPFIKWIMENPDGTATVQNHFRITTVRDGVSEMNDFEWSAADLGWTLTTGGGLRKESRGSVWDTPHENRTETYLIKNAANEAVYKEVVKYHLYPDPIGETVVEKRVGPDANPLVTQWAYYDDPANDGANYGRMKSEIRPGGTWDRYEYDAFGRDSKTISSFLNAAPNADEQYCRVVEYSYDPVAPADEGTIATNAPRTIITRLLGEEIVRSYLVVTADYQREIICQTPGAVWDAADNLVTITKSCPAGAFAGRPLSSLAPDETMQLYAYSYNGANTEMTTTVYSGQPNGDGTAIIDGTQSITVIGSLGQALSRTTVDIASGIVVAQETYSNFDQFNCPQRVTYLDGTYRDITYGCCAVDSERDRDGTVTTYTYDALKRLLTTTRNGITTINNYDAAGNVLSTMRKGTDSTQITLNSATYDLAGRQTHSTDAMNNPTDYGETLNGSGQLVRSTTNANGGTRIATYFKDGSLKSLTGTAVHGTRNEYGVENDGDIPRAYTKEIKLNANGTDSSEWVKTYADTLGHTYQTVFPDEAASHSFYNAQGQLWKQVDPDGVTTLFQYNAKGEPEFTAVDMDRNDAIDFGGTDRITQTVRTVAANASTQPNPAVPVQRTQTRVWTSDNDDLSIVASTQETSVDGLRSWNTAFGQVSQSQTVYAGNGGRTITATAPDLSSTVSQSQDGRLVSVTRKDSTGAQIGQTSYQYDAHGRQWKTTDARNGDTTFTSNNADQVATVTTPDPDGSGPATAQTTTALYDNMGHVWKVKQPDEMWVTNEYHLTGELKKTSGSRTYPVGYSYDYAGRMKTMTNWTTFPTTGARVTTWNYDAQRGSLSSKRYADNLETDYAYTPAGRLQTRDWARGITTTYGYNNAGELQSVDYSDGTPSVATVYDRRGRAVTATSAGVTTSRAFNDAGQQLTESYAGGPLDGFSVNNGYDTLLRCNALSLNSQLQSLSTVSYAYDAASRLQTVTSGTETASYSYLANSPQVENITFKQNGATRMTTTRQYDKLNRLTQISSVPSASSAVNFNYAYNNANQRTAVTNTDNSKWSYQYDSLGQVKYGKKFWSDGTIVAGQQFEYTFDDIGNRKTTKSGGDGAGSNLRQASYTPNSLNQYTSRSVPIFADIFGTANANAIVTVNLQPTTRKSDYFRKELTVNNTGGPVWLGVTNVGVRPGTGAGGLDIVTTNQGHLLIPQYSESFSYDEDGNLTGDSLWSYTYDAENRIIGKESQPTVPQAAWRKLEYTLDHQGRRVQVKIYDGSTGSWVLASDRKYVYAGWELLAELDAGNNGVTRSFVWGLDLSGSRAGAGGVGGLLAFTQHSTPQPSTEFFAYDGNGNVTALINSADGTETGRYDYDPFGQTLRATGPLARLNPFRFSTKWHEDETGNVHYEYRDYQPPLGRWLSRDPIDEYGGVNLYSFVGDDPANVVDPLGKDFIAVGDRYVVFTPGASRHMSIEFFEERCPQTPQGAKFSKGSKPKSANRTDSYELQPLRNSYRHFFTTQPKPTGPPVQSFVWDLVSEIRNSSTPKDFAVIYSDFQNPSRDASAKWNLIVAAATTYPYGEQESNYGTLLNWPNSKYELFGNNSNTFPREMAKVIGRNADVVGGWHPGNLTALPVTDPGYVPVFSPWGWHQ